MAITGTQVTYTALPQIGIGGMLQGSLDQDIITLKNTEATASMPFGIAVCWRTSGATSDIDALLPATQSDLVAAIVVHSHFHPVQFTDIGGSHGELGATGLVPGTTFNALRRGKVLVPVPSSLTIKPSDRLFVRAVSNGAISTQLGSCENAADSTNMIDCTKQGQWLTTPVNNLAWLDVDFTAKP